MGSAWCGFRGALACPQTKAAEKWHLAHFLETAGVESAQWLGCFFWELVLVASVSDCSLSQLPTKSARALLYAKPCTGARDMGITGGPCPEGSDNLVTSGRDLPIWRWGFHLSCLRDRNRYVAMETMGRSPRREDQRTFYTGR